MQGSRESELAKGQGTALADATPPSEGALLLVRLWPAAEEGDSDERFWESETPAVGLTLDLIAASDGVRAATLGRLIVAKIPAVESAIATARRLQWAIQGFAEGEGLQGTAAAALIHGGTELPDPLAESDWVRSLQRANPGQILLTQEACEAVAQVPGYSLASAVAGSPRELAWLRPKAKTDRGEDEQALDRLIEVSGNRVEAEESPAAPAAITPRPDAEEIEAVEERPRSSRKGLMIAAAIVVLLGAVALAAIFLRKPAQTPSANVPTATAPASPVAPAAATQPAVTSQAGGATPAPTQPATVPASEQKLSPKELRAQKREQKKEAQQAAQGTPAPAAPATDDHPPQKAAGGRCEIDEGSISSVIEIAERSLAAGKYRQAAQSFNMVLNCQPGNTSARQGYEKARQSQQMEGDSPN
jgi:hypothetical protein